MQLTENDETQDMPDKLPDDFFIPDAEYDAATADLNAQSHDVTQTTDSSTTG